MNDALQQLLDRLTALLAEKPLIGAWYTTVVRFVFPLLALMILVGAIRSLWKVKHPDEVWGYLVLRNGVRLPITHWENIIGRAPSCDVQLEYPSVSRQHAALIREDDGSWTIYDLGSKGGIKVNDLRWTSMRSSRTATRSPLRAFPLSWSPLPLRKSVHRWSSAALRASRPACGVRSYC